MGIRARRQREKEQRRLEILDAAKTLFKKRGFGGTTIRQIAEKCELAPATIYLYFPDKNHIYAELLIEGYDLLIDKLNKIVKNNPEQDNVTNLIGAFFDFALVHPEYFSLIFFVVQSEGRGILDLFHPDSDIYQRVNSRKQACLQLITKSVGNMRKDFSEKQAFITAETAWSMLAGVVYYFVKDGLEAFEVVTAQAKQMLITSIEHLPTA